MKCDKTKEIKDYLQRAYRLSKRIDLLIAEYEELDKKRLRLQSFDYSAIRVKSTSKTDMTDGLIILEKMMEKISKTIGEYEMCIADTKSAILLIEGETEKEVLYRRYVLFERWEQIAVNMNYSIQHVFRMHGSGLSMLKNMRVNESLSDGKMEV